MVTFQHKMAAGLSSRGLEVCYELADTPYRAVLVIGGTRQLAGLSRIRRQGIPIIQRLDGMNWMHRLPHFRKRGISLRLYLRSEYGNWLLSTIRSHLASRIVYQSQFVRGWWEGKYGTAAVPAVVIHNAVDLSTYSPQGSGAPPEDHLQLLLVEGSLAGGYQLGLEFAIELARRLAVMRLPFHHPKVELAIVGRVPPEVKQRWEREIMLETGERPVHLTWLGILPENRIPEIDRSAHLLYAADINSACPNSVIEALACGLPVVAFDSGALSELVSEDAGRVVPYGGDPWKLEKPDFSNLATSAVEIMADWEHFRRGARLRAEQAFDLQRMLDAYLTVLLEG